MVSNIRQISKLPSSTFAIAILPFGLTLGMALPGNTAARSPVATSHNRAVLSSDRVTTQRLSRLNATSVTGAVCPFSEYFGLLLPRSHSRAVASRDAVAIHLLS